MRAMQWCVCVCVCVCVCMCQFIVKQTREQKKSRWYECDVTDENVH